MGGWRDFAQRWVLRSSIKQGRKATRSQTIDDKDGILLIFPFRTEDGNAMLPIVSDWLKDREDGVVRVIVPADLADKASRLRVGVSTISITDEDITRSGVPIRELRRRVNQTPSVLAINLCEEPDPVTETLFAIAPSRFKAALFDATREPYTDLLVQPRQKHASVKTTQFLLDAICTFAGNRVPTRATSDSIRRAAERFSKPQPRTENDNSIPTGSPA